MPYGKEYYKKHRNRIIRRNLDYYYKNREHLLQKRAELRRKKINLLKHEIFILLGNKCQRCGFNDARAFQIDHVKGDGCKEMMSLQRKNIVRYYRKVLESIKNGENKYQLLCANCNWIKRVEKKEYKKH